jgi:hypothetical protein
MPLSVSGVGTVTTSVAIRTALFDGATDGRSAQ